MPKDKRTKEYKEWYKKYGEIPQKDKKSSSKKSEPKIDADKIEKNIKLKDLVILFDDKVESQDWVSKRKDIEEIKKRIEDLGGFEKLVPTEGIVFVYKGKTYKLTGLFAPINQLLGIGGLGDK